MLQGYKTKILAFLGATITLLQVFNVTNFTQEQVSAITVFFALGLALAIRDTIVKKQDGKSRTRHKN